MARRFGPRKDTDPFTHGTAGAFIACAWPQRWAVPKVAATCVTAALLPDADMFLPDAFNPDAVLAHRGFTHTLFGIVVLAAGCNRALVVDEEKRRRLERESARFISYHYTDKPERKGAFDDATKAIRSLMEG